MSAVYFWHKDQLVTFDWEIKHPDMALANMHKYRYCPCVDTFQSRKAERYGHWAVSNDWITQWVYRPFEGFPPEFKAHLLLLGVS
jgi:hypothetical protein